jgi:RimJ/RimL family protein N-acetyltransferase
VYAPFRRRGFGREAAVGMMRWAYERRGQRCFVLSIAPGNMASVLLAQSLGFLREGSQVDEEDGVEDVYVRRISAWPKEWE